MLITAIAFEDKSQIVHFMTLHFAQDDRDGHYSVVEGSKRRQLDGISIKSYYLDVFVEG